MNSQPRADLDGVPQLGDIHDGLGPVHCACLAVLDFGRPSGLTAATIPPDQALGVLRLTGWTDRLGERQLAAALRRFTGTAALAHGQSDMPGLPRVVEVPMDLPHRHPWVSRHSDGLWQLDVDGHHFGIVTTDQGRQLAADLFAALYLADAQVDGLRLGERLSVLLDAVADLLGRLNDEDES